MSIHEIEQRLDAARYRCEEAAKALAPKHKGGEWQEFLAAHEAVLVLERELAAARGEEHAVPLGFPVEWDVGAPLPHVIQNDYKTFLTFYVREPAPGWDGSYVTVKDPGDGSFETLALVEFQGCVSAKLGSPNDEVHQGHPLDGKGLEGYTAQRVVNSRWLADLEMINSVHACYDPARWRDLCHYVFWFHDTTFECVARSHEVEVIRESNVRYAGTGLPAASLVDAARRLEQDSEGGEARRFGNFELELLRFACTLAPTALQVHGSWRAGRCRASPYHAHPIRLRRPLRQRA